MNNAQKQKTGKAERAYHPEWACIVIRLELQHGSEVFCPILIFLSSLSLLQVLIGAAWDSLLFTHLL